MIFVELLRDYKILIPKIQRDYAQGRAKYNKSGMEVTSEKPYQVRVGLVNALYDGIDTQKKVDLNFVYGKTRSIDDKNVFIPIDGQQRLTTLFLFHWYVYQRANLYEDIVQLGEGFSYDTRDTTKQFCKELCKGVIWSDDDMVRIERYIVEREGKKKPYKLSTEITDKIWFTSNYANDPSVRSMLVMIDAIEEKFILSGKYKNLEDFQKVAHYLKSDDCTITFSHLGVENFDDEDMYIKMNARGKELTNFEIFKARLEEGTTLLNVCYSLQDSSLKKIQKVAEFIGKYNNEFTNLFYSLPEISKDSYDVALFHFVESFIKYDHFAFITGHTKVSEEYYYEDFSNTIYTGASLYNDYVVNPTLHGYKKDNCSQYINEMRIKAKDSIAKTTNILEFFVKNGFDNLPEYKNNMTGNNTTYDEKKLIVSNVNESSNNILVTQYALLSFLHEIECITDFVSKKKAYKEWKRFVCNITYRFTVKDPVNFAKMAGVFNSILLRLRELYVANNKNIENNDVLTVIRDYYSISTVRDMSMEVIRHLFDSEAQKAKLMLDAENGSEWDRVIRAAEDYYDDGNIDFLFDALESNFSPSEFERIFIKSKRWFDSKKEPKDSVTFNEALLCLDYPDEYEEMAHLRVYYYDEVWQLYCGKQSNLRDALANGDKGKAKSVQYGVKELLKLYDLNMEPREYADLLIASYIPKQDCWLRNILISERLVLKLDRYKNLWNFSGTIGRWSQTTHDEYILFYSTAYNSNNLEFNTFRLAMKLIEKNPEIVIELISGKTRTRDRRYIVLNNKKVSYDIEQKCFYNIDKQVYFESNNGDYGMDAAIKYLTV